MALDISIPVSAINYNGDPMILPQPSGKITITENGTDIDVSQYATADVNVSGGGFAIHEKGTVFIHTGSANKQLTIPVSDNSHDNYWIVAHAIKSWLFVDEEWKEQETLDFTGATNSNAIFRVFTGNKAVVDAQTLTDTTGTSRNVGAVYGYCQYSRINASYQSNMMGINPANKVGTDGFRIISANPYFCDTTWGLTFSYEIWGWDD